MNRWVARLAVLPVAAVVAYLVALLLRHSFCTLAQQLAVWSDAFVATTLVAFCLLERRFGSAWPRAAAVSLLVSFSLLLFFSLTTANLFGAVTRSRQIRSRAAVRAVAVVLGAEQGRTGAFPVASSVAELNSRLGETLPDRDGWGNILIVRSEPGRSVVISVGECGEPEQVDPWAYQPAATHETTADIVYLNGKAWRYPEGIQE